MASLILRNVVKFNANIIKAAPRFSAPLKSYASLVNAQRVAMAKPLNLVTPVVRNISTTAPKMMSAGGGNHAAIWTLERAVSAAMLAVLPAAFLFPSKGLDALLAASIVLHSHWGIEAMITDYMRPILFGNVVPKVAHGLLILISVATLGGLLYIIQNDVGIARSIQKIWAVKGVDQKQ